MSEDSAAALPSVTRRVNQRAALLLASFGALLAFLDVTIVNVAFPSIQQSFPHSTYGDLSWVLNSYNIVFAALLVVAGRLADLFGRRRTFTVGLVVFTLASAGCAAAPDVASLIAFRCVQAVGAALVVPSSLALVVEAFASDRRAHAIGLWGATAAFAAGLGPPLGGALVQLDNWRLAFLVNVPLGVVAVAAAGRALVESRAPGRRRLPDLPGAALLGAAMASLTFAIVQGPAWGWADVRVVVGFVLAMLLAAAFTASSRRHPVPVLDPKLLRIPTFAVANVVTFIAGMGFYAYLLNNILWLHYVWGWGLLRSGLAVAPGAVVAAVVAGLLGDVADRRGYRVIAVPGAFVWAGAYVWYLTAVGTHPHFLSQWLPGQVLSGIGVGMTLPIVASAALAAVPGGRYATASAVVSSTRQLGAVVGIALLVVIVGSPSPASAATAFRHGWVLSIVCFAVAGVGSVGLRKDAAAESRVEETPAPSTPELHLQPLVVTAGSGIDRSPVLARLSATTRARLLDTASVVPVEAGEWLFRAGDPTDAMYVVRSGRLEVVGDGGVIRELGDGDVVGELGLLTGATRSAGVCARRDSVLWRVTPEQFDTVLRRDNKALRALAGSLAEHLQANQSGADQQRRLPRVVSVVGFGDDAPVLQAAQLLHDELAATLDVHLSHGMSAEELHRVEPLHDRVVLVAPDPSDPWHGFCVRQADRLVVVASSASPPRPLDTARDGYVLLVGARPDAKRLVEWHDAVSPRITHAVEGDDLAPAVAGVARRIAGRSVGLAIAGGGARSLAAIGVVEEIERAGFVVDRLAGCSVGSVIATLFAMGHSASAVDAICYDEFVRRNPFNDYRLSSVSLTRGRKTEAAIGRRIADTVFEELPRELTVVSTDLINRNLVVHRRGPVGVAVRASLSLPGLFPPARVGESLHVDGGVLDNLPVEPLADFDEGPVVAVNIAAAASIRAAGPPRMPTLGETLLRTMLMAGTSNLDEARRRATVLVTPDTRGIGLLEFHQIDRARAAGQVAGQAVVEALRDRLGEADGPRSIRIPEQRDTVAPVLRV
jgi:EmrB/QacA subfamily drug resistance transporter